jgi:hypothetical protein
MQNEKHKELAEILHNTMLVNNEHHTTVSPVTFLKFRMPTMALNDYRNKRLGARRVNLKADLIKQRASAKITFDKLKQADILLAYVSYLNPSPYESFPSWFAETTCYDSYSIKILPKTISKKYFEKVKCIFNVASKEDLTTKVNNLNPRIFAGDAFYDIPDIRTGLGLEQMCSIP